MMKIKYRDGSLLINDVLCEAYGASKEGIEYVHKYYPDGFTPKDVVEGKTKYIPSYYINWGYHNLPFTDDDKQRYKDYRHITNCTSFYMSNDIDGGSYIVDSSFIENSNYIRDSVSVFNSNYVRFGEDIEYSDHIIGSSHVTQSDLVYNSTKIAVSNFIFNCNNIEFCDWLVNCSNVSESILCKDIHNCRNCILCNEEPKYEEGNYYFLNKGVSRATYLRMKEQISRYIMNLVDDQAKISEFNKPKINYVTFFHDMFTDFYLFLKDIYPQYSNEDKRIISSILYITE